MLWDPKLNGYCGLARSERGFLEQPFGKFAGKALAQPARVANRIPAWSKLLRQLTHRRNRLNLAAQLKSSDLILVPQIFRDSRGGLVTALGSQTGARRVGFFYDAIPWRRPDVTPSMNVKGVVEYMMALRDFDLIITSSREAADDLQACWQLHSPNSKRFASVHVLPWPTDESFDLNLKPARSPLHHANDRRKILCVGTLEPRKNQLTLLAAAERLWREPHPAFELELIGRTTRECGPRVLAEVNRLRAAGQPAFWRRHVDDDALLRAYDECVFTVFPSLLEGFGLPIVESLRRGKPCVCGANGALGEVAAGGGCLTVDQTDAAALADAMQRLLTDEMLYRRLCEEARARQFENWPGYVEKLRALLEPATDTQAI